MNADSQKKSASKPSLIERVPWNPWLGVVFIIIVYYSAQFAGGLLVSLYPALHNWSPDQITEWLNASVTAQFCYVLLAEGFILGAVYLFLKQYGRSFKSIGLVRPRWRDAGYGLLAVPVYYVFYLVTVAVVSHFVPGLDIDQKQQLGFENVHGFLALTVTFISLVILPALVEEIMVRGFLYSSLKKVLPTIAAVLVTSGLFAVAHLSGGAMGPIYIAAVDTFVLSLILIYLREKTGSLWGPITLHGIKNGTAFLVLFVFHLA